MAALTTQISKQGLARLQAGRKYTRSGWEPPGHYVGAGMGKLHRPMSHKRFAWWIRHTRNRAVGWQRAWRRFDDWRWPKAQGEHSTAPQFAACFDTYTRVSPWWWGVG